MMKQRSMLVVWPEDHEEDLEQAACDIQDTLDLAQVGGAQVVFPVPAMNWHLFLIEASDLDGVYVCFVSAESESEAMAQELAEASVLEVIGIEEQPGKIDFCVKLGMTDADIFEKVGPV